MNVYNITVVVMHLSRWYDMAKSVFFMCIYLNWQAHLKWISHAGEICTCYVFFIECSCLYVCFSQWLHSFRAETLASGCIMAGKHEQHSMQMPLFHPSGMCNSFQCVQYFLGPFTHCADAPTARPSDAISAALSRQFMLPHFCNKTNSITCHTVPWHLDSVAPL